MVDENKRLPMISCASNIKRVLCPECGPEKGAIMKSIFEKEQLLVCTKCGLTIPADDLSQIRQESRPKPKFFTNRREEYLNWYLAPKDKKGM